MKTDQRTVDERRRDLLARISTEGAEQAYAAALAILADPKAAAPAKATSLTAILRAGGYFSAGAGEGPQKDPSQMSADELEQAIRDLRRKRSEPGVFD